MNNNNSHNNKHNSHNNINKVRLNLSNDLATNLGLNKSPVDAEYFLVKPK